MSRIVYSLIIIYSVLFTGLCYSQAPVTGSGSQDLSIDQRLDRLERMMQSQGLVDMIQQLQLLQREISTLRGEIETQNYNLEQLTRRQRDLYTDVDQRMQRLERGGPPQEEQISFSIDSSTSGEPPVEILSAVPNFGNTNPNPRSDSSLQVKIVDSRPTQQTNVPVVDRSQIEASATPYTQATPDTEINPVTATRVVAVDPLQLQAEYQQAFNLLRQSLYDQAIRGFQQFLVLHPKDKYSDNAQYWLAETFYVKREFEQALIEYNNVVNTFPESQKVNDARLKIGYTLYELGDMEQAKNQLQELLETLPGTTVARLADERLKIINSSSQDTPSVSN